MPLYNSLQVNVTNRLHVIVKSKKYIYFEINFQFFIIIILNSGEAEWAKIDVQSCFCVRFMVIPVSL